MIYVLAWISLVLISVSLVFLNKWVKEEALVYALVGLGLVEISIIFILANLSV